MEDAEACILEHRGELLACSCYAIITLVNDNLSASDIFANNKETRHMLTVLLPVRSKAVFDYFAKELL